MRYFLYILFTFNILTIYSQSEVVDNSSLKGQVKSFIYESKFYFTPGIIDVFKKIEYQFNVNGKITHKSNISYFDFDEDTSYSNYQWNYDILGNYLSEELYYQNSELFSKTQYKTDSSGRVLNSLYFNGNEFYNTKIYIYNESKKLTEIKCKTINGFESSEFYNYDNKGNMIYYAENSPTLKQNHYWTFDENNRLIEEKYLDTNWSSQSTYIMKENGELELLNEKDFSNNPNTEASYLIYYKYNPQGYLIEENKLKLNGTIITKSSFIYNENGDAIREDFFDSEMNKTFIKLYEYIYDHKGNWISKTTYIDRDVLQNETRKIIYY
jgi:hypothetical protein